MKKFKVTVNGQVFEVEVEEMNGGPVSRPAAPVATPAPVAAAPVAAPVVPVAAAPAAEAPATQAKQPIPEDAVRVKAPMPGKIVLLKAKAGQVVKRGDVLLVLEAMKMQNDIMSPADGTVLEVCVSEGDNVKTGEEMVILA